MIIFCMLERFIWILICRLGIGSSVFKGVMGLNTTSLEFFVPFILPLILLFGLHFLAIGNRLGMHTLLSVYFSMRKRGIHEVWLH